MDHPSVGAGECKATDERSAGGAWKCTPGRRDSLIYFVQAAPGWPIKVGFSNNMDRRILILRSASGLNLKVLGVMDGDYELEATLHRRFKAHRIVGEWFKPTVGLVKYIEENARTWQERPRKGSRGGSYYLPPLETLDEFPKAEYRKIGKGASSSAEERHLRDQVIARMDREGAERWQIAAVTGLCESQIYRRLAKIRAARSSLRDDIAVRRHV